MLPFFSMKPQNDLKQLWEKEKKEYRPWIFGFLALAVIFVISSLSILILSIIKLTSATETNTGVFVVASMLFFIFGTLGTVNYIIGLKKSYKEKNFARISPNSTSSLFFGSFLYNLYFFGGISWQLQANISQPLYIVYLVSLPVAIGIILTNSKIRKICREFALVEAYEKAQEQLKNLNLDELLKDNAFGPLGEMFNQQHTKNTQEDQKAEPSNIHQETDEEIKIRMKLEDLDLDQLHKLAQKLEISGYQEMSREELIKILIKLNK
ncbi:Rho termination factor N-terminal domain-containing protein [Mycoplasma procyoni]|uniref:Rho termination factor N-terminal domain-containing protein n=1 Tax=Mycoplasma procyoni TaxID=568784 RepID=UPI00197C5295|nr:Rho termination factor N-terminal domain-containing protein [Mycoplasma procyoni]MBN3535010.1 hypothetical protein [Mycoplasma procyoni]